MRHLGSAILAVAALLVPAGPALACTGEQPTFDEAVAGATAIARVIVEDVTEYGEAPAGETFRVVRVLEGDLPSRYQLDEPRTGLCGDTIGYYAPVGSEVIVAFGVPFYETLVNPAWMATDSLTEPISGFGAPAPDGATSLDELESLILAALPDTAMATATGSWAVHGGVLVLIAATLLTHRVARGGSRR